MATDLQQAMGHDLRTEYHNKSGREAFMGMAHYPAYVQWLESELRAARQNVKVAEQTPTNSAMDAIVASDEYAKNNSSAGQNALKLAFMAGVEWKQGRFSDF